MMATRLLVLALASLRTVLGQDDACNGHAELCDRRYSAVSFAAAHNAAFVGTGPAHNQLEYPEQDMDRGIRYFTTQVHLDDGEIRQCHTDCALLNVGAFSEIVVSLKTWMDDHPREVLTLLVGNGDDAIDVEEFATVFEDAGAADMAFQPGGTLGLDDWPTLGEMIDSGERLVVFMDYYANLTRVPYIIPEFDQYVETPFSPTEDNFDNCDVDRPSPDTPVDDRMIFANHNLNDEFAGILVPARDEAEQTNSLDSIGRQSDLCVDNHGRKPNVVMLDWVSVGQAIEAQDALNGL